MKRLFIVTLATLMATASFANTRISTKPMEEAKRTKEELENKSGGKKTAKEVEDELMVTITESLKGEFLKPEGIKAGLEIIFEGKILEKLAFQKAITEAKKASSSAEAQSAAKYAENLLNYLTNSVISKEYKAEIADLLQNYATLLSELGPDAALKYEGQLKSMTYLTHPAAVQKAIETNTLKSADDIALISVARGMKADLGIEKTIRSVEDLKTAGKNGESKLDAAKELLKRFRDACGKKRG